MSEKYVLLVDDEPMNLKLYEKMLKDQWFQIMTATNGRECLVRVAEHLPDIIIMDWNMPVMNGIDALESLKSDSKTGDIPVIMITGVMTSPEDLSYAMSVGAIDFLKKPFDKQELTARVRNILLLCQSLNALKEQNRQLEDTNLFIRSLIDSIQHPVIYYSPEGVIRLFNQFFGALTGLAGDELTGTSVYRQFVVDEVSFHVQKDMEVIQSRGAITYEKRVFPGDRIYLVSKKAIPDNRGDSVGIVAVFTDVTDLKRAHETVMNMKKAELISSTLQVMHLNEMNHGLIQNLEKVNPHTSKDGQELIDQMVRQYKMTMAETFWSEIEARFEDTFNSFYKVLLERFPALTPNERKLCALIRSGLSSKDIAALTFQNPQSVDVARYRLRKKLSLETEENLTNFLLLIDS